MPRLINATYYRTEDLRTIFAETQHLCHNQEPLTVLIQHDNKRPAEPHDVWLVVNKPHIGDDTARILTKNVTPAMLVAGTFTIAFIRRAQSSHTRPDEHVIREIYQQFRHFKLRKRKTKQVEHATI